MRELDYGKMGMRIRQVRKARGWSQAELARKCGISMSFLGHIERGSRIMSIETFANICRALESGADELLWGIVGPSDAVIGMWKGRNDTVEKDSGERSGRKTQIPDGNDTVTDENARDMADNGRYDSYEMYVKIMKSVAEIMNET